ncbi:MAG: hypothetical protein ACE5J3_02950 [Methanosarcinales archaeon]
MHDKYTADQEIVQYLPPSAKGKESEEHFVIKQLSLKNITELDGRDYKTEGNKETAKGEDYPEEMPDIAFKKENKNIWIEIETRKELRRST